MPDTTAAAEGMQATGAAGAGPKPSGGSGGSARPAPARKRAQRAERVEQAKTAGAVLAALGLLCTISATFHTYVLEPSDQRVTSLEAGAAKTQGELSSYREDAAVTRTRLNALVETVDDTRADVRETKEDVKEILRELRRR